MAEYLQVVGVDVGERYLDLALIDRRRRSPRFERIDLATANDRPLETIAAAFRELRIGSATLVLVDSPQCPRPSVERPREIDCELYRVIAKLNSATGRATRLSMFPTPTANYFHACGSDPTCPAHLRSIAPAVFGVTCKTSEAAPVGGQIFTRFMLAGFATHRALGLLDADTFESYPYLAFELWRDPELGETLPPKRRRRDALVSRVAILARLVRELGLGEFPTPDTLDQADAAALAVTAALALNRGRLLRIEAPLEGRFALALDRVGARFPSSS